ncbi:CusA/CzcA family heavy metal efflux RND transporter [Adhaeribacter arboris]|uniref:CusA/CzcA family heavy metal efflux RND transporter n=1 Tax=Adhaeribacter arboris TaxID=2072846 RepID=A0A2T2YM90_9BACT|nr:CusA/CzcA family heavy metal efflux RND transporter [Adhaeribacter arboris]PSR56624.1 CusA/CzcA family heavy metal efflux RND transporter [Adhaeribacter arboris]
MLDRIIHFSIHNKLIIGLFTLALILWGSYSVTQLTIDAVPDITNNQVQVITQSPSLAAQEVERLISFPVEVTMATIPDIEEIRSFSRFGLSVVTIVFKDKVDIYWARQQVSERLREAENQIPAGVGSPELAPVSTGLGEIYQYVLHTKKGYSKKYSDTDLRTIQDWIVRQQLLGTPGVADVSSFGGHVKQYEIAIDPERLRSINISISDIFTALEKNNQNTGGAYIDRKPNAYFIRSEGLASSIDDIQKIVVKSNENGVPVLIRDVATVQFGSAVRYGAMTRNAEGEVVGGLVLMLKGANASQVIKAVKEKVATIEKTLPEGVVIEPFLDRSKLVNNAIGTVTRNLAEGALIVIFVLVLLLGNLRAGLIVASVIPLSMLFAISLMNVFGVSGNLMSLGAIDFGLIVDGAVIIVEATLHHLGARTLLRPLTQGEMDEEVYQSASKIRNSAAFGEIIILIVYLPILALVGIEGKMFRPMAQTVAFAIVGAFILSLTYVPMVSALFLSKKKEYRKTIADRIMGFFHRLYAPLIVLALRHKSIVLITALLFFLGSLFLFLRMGGEFIPSLSEGDFAVETRVLSGSSISQTIEASTQAADILLKKFPDEVKEVVGKIGSGEIPTDPMPVEAIDLMIILKDKENWVKADNSEDLANEMAEALEAIPGVTFGFQQPIQMRFNELMSGARQDVVIKVYGEDLGVLSEQAGKVGRIVKTVKGAQDLYVEQITGLPQIVITFDRDKIAQFGLNIEDVNQAIQTGFAGQSAGVIYEGEKRFEMVVRLASSNRQSLEDVQGLYVTTPHGDQVPLEQVAQIGFKTGASQIQRDDAKRRITIGFNVRGRDIESIVEELQAKINTQLKFPPGYYVTYGGQFENLEKAKMRLTVAVPVALLLIFLLLFFTFRSIAQSLLIFTAIPLSAIGGVVALWMRDMPFSISAGVGFIALFGVAVLNGIVLISYFNQLKAEGIADITERVLKGTEVRLRPVIMTALVASLGFLPMALSNTAGAEVQKPLATVVIGGLVSATLLTLVVLPILYILLEQFMEKQTGVKQRVVVPLGKAFILVLLAGIGIFLPGLAHAQEPQPLTLPQAIDLALSKNISLEAANFQVSANKTLQGAAVDIGKTNIETVYGQINSVNKDNNFTVTQSFAFPTVYTNQSRLAKANIRGSELNRSILQREIVQEVKNVYQSLIYLEAKLQLLEHQDSLYSNFAKASNSRLRTGETNLLENATAQAQQVEVKNSIEQTQAEQELYKTQLQTLIGSQAPVSIVPTPFARLPVTVPDTAILPERPQLAIYEQQKETAKIQTKLERARTLPDFTIGYFNQSIIGLQNVNGVDRNFTGDDRFNGVQVGISVPLWYGAHSARIKAAQYQEKLADATYRFQQTQQTTQLKLAIQRLRKQETNLDYYEKTGLPLADLIIKHAEKGFQNGVIDYLEYVQSLNRALTIKANHLEALHQFNTAAIALEFISGQ